MYDFEFDKAIVKISNVVFKSLKNQVIEANPSLQINFMSIQLAIYLSSYYAQ